jgi:hypothetical protein
MQDEEGQDIVAGDGFVQQVKGANDMDASNADGTFTYADLVDMVKQIKKKKNRISGNTYVAVTGSDGIANADTVLTGRFTGLTGGAVLVQNVNQTDKVGGADITVGYNFKKINISGDQIVFVENPMMDDEEKFTRRLSNGNLAMSNTVYFLDMDTDDRGTGNVEIRARGRAGVNRNIVYLWENGMTGEGTPTNPVDAKAFHMLKETLLAVYNTRSCGILKPSATA